MTPEGQGPPAERMNDFTRRRMRGASFRYMRLSSFSDDAPAPAAPRETIDTMNDFIRRRINESRMLAANRLTLPSSFGRDDDDAAAVRGTIGTTLVNPQDSAAPTVWTGEAIPAVLTRATVADALRVMSEQATRIPLSPSPAYVPLELMTETPLPWYAARAVTPWGDRAYLASPADDRTRHRFALEFANEPWNPPPSSAILTGPV